MPANVFAGIETWKVVTSACWPMPEPAAAVKNLTAVGGVVPAGTLTGNPIAFVGAVQVATQELVTPVIVVADVESVRTGGPAAVKVVEVTVRFQLAPLPVASITVSGIVAVGVLFVPSITTAIGVHTPATSVSVP